MGKKRKSQDPQVAGNGHDDEESSGDEDFDMVNVDFEFFDPQPATDFHGIKNLTRQLFDLDATLFDLSAITDLILSQPTLGSTVKVDGNESDPYAFLTVLNLQEHKDQPFIVPIIDYLRSKSSYIPTLTELLSPESKAEIGLILTERLINMPPEVMPPMYTMLLEEISWAVDDKEPYTFTHYLILSKTYREVESTLDKEDAPSTKKAKKDNSQDNTFYFHPEDEIFHKFALGYSNYSYTKDADEGRADSKRTFQEMGIEPQGHLILIEKSRFEDAINAVKEYLKP